MTALLRGKGTTELWRERNIYYSFRFFREFAAFFPCKTVSLMVKYDRKAKVDESPRCARGSRSVCRICFTLWQSLKRWGSNPRFGLLTHLFAGSNPAVYRKGICLWLRTSFGTKTLRNVSQNRNRSNIPTGLCRSADTATAQAGSKV